MKNAEQRAVPGTRLDYSVRARRDIEALERFHSDIAGHVVADRIVDAIQSQAEKIVALGLMFRPGIRRGTRECVMTSYPYTLIYRVGPRGTEIARIIHQRAEYFQRKR